ncbi:MAG: PIG-L family deacetylase [Oxalobacter sp.]|nr:PIG-L family deacetylase [Oxalobacter sp.]
MDILFSAIPEKPVDLRTVRWQQKYRMLVTAPHPDDFDAISMTLRLLKEAGHELYAVVAQTGSGIDKVYGAGMSQQDRTQLRNREQQASFAFFGLPESHYRILALENAPDDQVDYTENNIQTLEGIVQEIRPDVLFMPHGNDTNRAHRDMCRMMRSIARRMAWPIALMLNSDVKTVDMRKDCYLAFSKAEAAWKGQLLRHHDSQHQRNLRDRGHGFDDRVLMLNARTAQGLGVSQPYAESFEIEMCD